MRTECEGPGATHHHACACREEHFRKLEAEVIQLRALVHCAKFVISDLSPGHPWLVDAIRVLSAPAVD